MSMVSLPQVHRVVGVILSLKLTVPSKSTDVRLTKTERTRVTASAIAIKLRSEIISMD